jgi:chromosome segregation ATPase
MEQRDNEKKTDDEKINIKAWAERIEKLEKDKIEAEKMVEDANKLVKDAENTVDKFNAEALNPRERISMTEIKNSVEKNNQPVECKMFSYGLDLNLVFLEKLEVFNAC